MSFTELEKFEDERSKRDKKKESKFKKLVSMKTVSSFLHFLLCLFIYWRAFTVNMFSVALSFLHSVTGYGNFALIITV